MSIRFLSCETRPFFPAGFVISIILKAHELSREREEIGPAGRYFAQLKTAPRVRKRQSIRTSASLEI